jgi:hypothetical protein
MYEMTDCLKAFDYYCLNDIKYYEFISKPIIGDL